MSLPSRRDYMSRLAIEDCDICHEPMSDPARTDCRHFFCFECLKAWLESNNTCPTCRTQLFEETEPNTAQDAERQGDTTQAVLDIPVGQRMAIVRDLNEMMARLRVLEANVSRLGEAQTPPLVVDRATEQAADRPQTTRETDGLHGNDRAAEPAYGEGELSYDALVAYSHELQPRPEELLPMVTFDGAAMTRLLDRLLPEQRARPDWYEQLRTRAVRYTFTIDGAVARLHRASCDFLSLSPGSGTPFDETNRRIRSAYSTRQSQWFDKVLDLLRDVSVDALSSEVRRLMQEEVHRPLEELSMPLLRYY